ncbi:MAG: sulfatase [Lacipirellulaceae bacterium]
MAQRQPTLYAAFAALAAWAGLAAATASDSAEVARPNVVVFLVDDLGWADLGCYGSTFYETPNLDRLARRGVRFTDAYAACPVCSPSRAALLTGRSPARLGLTAHIGDSSGGKEGRPLATPWSRDRLEHSERTLAEALHDAGYATMHSGKWHMGQEPYYPEYQGFDVNAGGWLHGGPFTGKGYFSPYENPRLSDGPNGEYLTERLANETAEFIQAHRHEPFFVQHAFYQVHVPLQAKEAAIRKYEAKRATLPPIAKELVEGRDAPERARQDLPVYAAMVEAMDAAVGRVLRAIDQSGVADRTIVVFTSDNGGLATGDRGISADQGWPTTNAPLRSGKGWLYEGGIRVPLIAAGPGVTNPGRTSPRVVNGTDHFATIIELVGLDESIPQDSQSYALALRGAAPQRGPVFWHYPHYGNQGGRPAGAVRDGRWKLVEWYSGAERPDSVELYDLQSDLGESNDLACERTEVAARLHESLTDYRREVGARMPSTPTPRLSDSKPAKAAATTAKR